MNHLDEVKGLIKVKCTFTIPSEYPCALPTVAFSSTQISNSILSSFKVDMVSYCETLEKTTFLLDLLFWIKDNLANYILQSRENLITHHHEENTMTVTSLLKLDHMRAKAKYLKTLQKWSMELDVAVAVLFKNNQIIIVLQGNTNNIKVKRITKFVNHTTNIKVCFGLQN